METFSNDFIVDDFSLFIGAKTSKMYVRIKCIILCKITCNICSIRFGEIMEQEKQKVTLLFKSIVIFELKVVTFSSMCYHHHKKSSIL